MHIELSRPDYAAEFRDKTERGLISDNDIACPLFYRLQEYFNLELGMTADQSRDNARHFMWSYWKSKMGDEE